MPKILTAAGKGAELTPTEADSLFYREVNPQSVSYTVDTGDNLATIEYTGAGGHTITLPDVSTLLAAEDTGAFMVRIKHGGTGTLTVARGTGNTIEGAAANITLNENGCVTLKAGSVADDWMVVSRYNQLSGTFTGTLTGVTTSPTANCRYSIVGDLAAINFPEITGLSNTTGATITGLPSVLVPQIAQHMPARIVNYGITGTGLVLIEGSLISLYPDAGGSGFNASGLKGIWPCTVSFFLV